jgi:Uma2 family endonuclease
MDPSPQRLPAGPLTYEDYAAIPNDGNRYEILDGELYVTPAPVPRHQRVLQNLFRILDTHVRHYGIGEVLIAPIDVILSPTTVAQPDLLFIRSGRDSIVTERAVEGAPDLVVEVLSPWSIRQDRTIKAGLYARFAVPSYWILDPAERVFEAYTLDGEAYRLSSRATASAIVTADPFGDLAIPLGDAWV